MGQDSSSRSRLRGEHIHVGVPQGLQRPHVLPVTAEAVGGHPFSIPQHGGDHIFAEVIFGVGVGLVSLQIPPQGLPGEDVDAHGR